MNTWTDSGLSEAGLIGAKLALGLEARLPDGPARSSNGATRASGASHTNGSGHTNGSRVVPPGDIAPQRSGRRRAAEPGVAAPAAGRRAGDYTGSGSHAAVEPLAAADPFPSPGAAPLSGAARSSGLTGSFPLTGAAKLYAPEPVPLPSEPLPPEPSASLPPLPAVPMPLPSEPMASVPMASQPVTSRPTGERDQPRSPTDGFLAGGFSPSFTDSPWGSGSLSSGMSSGIGGSWSQPVPITPQSPPARESELSPAVSAPTSLMPMPKTPASHRAELTSSDSSDSSDGEWPEQAEHSEPYRPRESFNFESNTLGSLDSSNLFAALSRHSR
jgi:hypothetical protein